MARRSERRTRRRRDDRERFGVWRWLRNSFFTGIVVATPVAVTAYLVYAFITFVDNQLKPRIPDLYNPETYLREIPGIPEEFAIPGLGLAFAAIVLTMLGAFARNFFGRSLLSVGERIVHRLPVIRNIYSALKQIVESIAAQRESSFKEVALVEYPRKGLWALAFVTASAKSEVRGKLGEGYVGIFVPSTPNPTSGFILYTRREDLHILDMTVEEGAKLIISAGLVSPGEEAEQQQQRRGRRRRGEQPGEPAGNEPAVVFTELPDNLRQPNDEAQ